MVEAQIDLSADVQNAIQCEGLDSTDQLPKAIRVEGHDSTDQLTKDVVCSVCLLPAFGDVPTLCEHAFHKSCLEVALGGRKERPCSRSHTELHGELSSKPLGCVLSKSLGGYHAQCPQDCGATVSCEMLKQHVEDTIQTLSMQVAAQPTGGMLRRLSEQVDESRGMIRTLSQEVYALQKQVKRLKAETSASELQVQLPSRIRDLPVNRGGFYLAFASGYWLQIYPNGSDDAAYISVYILPAMPMKAKISLKVRDVRKTIAAITDWTDTLLTEADVAFATLQGFTKFIGKAEGELADVVHITVEKLSTDPVIVKLT